MSQTFLVSKKENISQQISTIDSWLNNSNHQNNNRQQQQINVKSARAVFSTMRSRPGVDNLNVNVGGKNYKKDNNNKSSRKQQQKQVISKKNLQQQPAKKQQQQKQRSH